MHSTSDYRNQKTAAPAYSRCIFVAVLIALLTLTSIHNKFYKSYPSAVMCNTLLLPIKASYPLGSSWELSILSDTLPLHIFRCGLHIEVWIRYSDIGVGSAYQTYCQDKLQSKRNGRKRFGIVHLIMQRP